MICDSMPDVVAIRVRADRPWSYRRPALAALLADPDTPIGERLDSAAQAEGLDSLAVHGPALVGLRELMRIGIVRSAG